MSTMKSPCCGARIVKQDLTPLSVLISDPVDQTDPRLTVEYYCSACRRKIANRYIRRAITETEQKY